MLRQNINLYISFKVNAPKLKHLSWRHLVIGSITFTLLLVLSSLFQIADCFYEKFNAYQLNQRVITLTNQIETKKKHYPDFFFSENVDNVVTEMQKSIQQQSQLLAKIVNHTSFSDILIAIAKVDTQNSWLHQIEISDGGNIIRLYGNVLSLDDFKLYFYNIEKEALFKGDHLSVDKIELAPTDTYPDFQNFSFTISKPSNETN